METSLKYVSLLISQFYNCSIVLIYKLMLLFYRDHLLINVSVGFVL